MALYHREVTGEGQYVEVAQIEGVIPFLGDALMEFGLNNLELPRSSSGRPPPYGCFPALGDDRWIVIGVTCDSQWESLCVAMGRPDLLADSELRSGAGRLVSSELVNEAVAAWTAMRDPDQLAQQLADAGIAASPVRSAASALQPMRAAGYLIDVDHPEAGRHPYPGITVRMSETAGAIRKPAPLFGQDNDYVLGTLLGLSGAELADLRTRKVVTDLPLLSSSGPMRRSANPGPPRQG